MAATATVARTWSGEQLDIFKWLATPVEGTNLVVEAYAGCAKTTTMVEGANRIPAGRRVIACAFNNKIAAELQTRMRPGIESKTLHSIGRAIVCRFKDGAVFNFDSTREDTLAAAVCGKSVPDAIRKLVGKLCTKGRDIEPHATAAGSLIDLAINFECVPPDDMAEMGFDLDFVERKALEAMELASDPKKGDILDGTDMIFLPVRNGWMHRVYDDVLIDEAQDMNKAMIELALGICKLTGRITVVGDRNQAIYAFRGADSESISRLHVELKADRLTLPTTYRCGKAIVEVARQYVPDFRAGDNNPDGEVLSIVSDKLTATAGPGDFILSRMNAPLVPIAMSLLKAGKRCRIVGRDIGKSLVTLVRKTKARTVPEFNAKITAWETKEVARLMRQFNAAGNNSKRQTTVLVKVDGIREQASMLLDLAEGAKSIENVIERIEWLFTDDGLGDAGLIHCSSVHKAKGLEANRVFVLRGTLRQHNQEELNIAYVAITRARETLVWVD